MRKLRKIGVLFIFLFIFIITKKQDIIKASSTGDEYHLGQTKEEYNGESTVVVSSDSVAKQEGENYTYKPAYKNVTKVIFEKDVAGTYAILGRFPNVEEVQISASVLSINVTELNTKLERFIVSENNNVYSSIDGVLYTNDDGVTRIACYPMGKKDTEYKVPENVSLLKSKISNNFVKKLIIGKNPVTDNYFMITIKDQFTSLEAIEITSKQAKHITKDGVVFNKDGTVLVAYPVCGKAAYTVPEDTTTIGEYAFTDTNIKKVTLSADTKTITAYAFWKSKIETAVLPDNGVTNLGTYAFANSSLKKIALPKGLKKVGNGAFRETLLVNVAFPDTIKVIGFNSFQNTNLTKLNIPKNLAKIEDNSFDIDEIKSVKVASGNKYFCVADGVLYNKAKTELLLWPSSKKVKTLKFPSTLKQADIGAICKASGATSIVIPKAMNYFPNGASNTFKTVKVTPGHKYLCVKNNVVYTKDLSQIMLYPMKSTTKSVVLAAGLKYLDLNVFGKTKNNVVMLTLPKSLKSVTSFYGKGSIPASGFVKLTTIKVASGNKYFKTKDGILYNKAMTKLYWFPINKNISSYTMPKTVTEVRNASLAKQNYLKEITLSDKCTKIDEMQYQEEGYEYVFYPGRECPKLKAINLNNKKSRYFSSDGVVYATYQGELVLYPNDKPDLTYTLNTGCSSISCNMKNKHLKELVLDAATNVYEMDFVDKRFDGLTALEKITVPSENKYVKSVDGVLYKNTASVYSNEECLAVLWYPEAKMDTTLILPATYAAGCLPECVYNSKYLTTLGIDKSNPYYYVEDNALYYKNGKLICKL